MHRRWTGCVASCDHAAGPPRPSRRQKGNKKSALLGQLLCWHSGGVWHPMQFPVISTSEQSNVLCLLVPAPKLWAWGWSQKLRSLSRWHLGTWISARVVLSWWEGVSSLLNAGHWNRALGSAGAPSPVSQPHSWCQLQGSGIQSNRAAGASSNHGHSVTGRGSVLSGSLPKDAGKRKEAYFTTVQTTHLKHNQGN